jgi:hypothetical protein
MLAILQLERTDSSPASSRTTWLRRSSWSRFAVALTMSISWLLSAMKKSDPSHRAGSMNVPMSGIPG